MNTNERYSCFLFPADRIREKYSKTANLKAIKDAAIEKTAERFGCENIKTDTRFLKEYSYVCETKGVCSKKITVEWRKERCNVCDAIMCGDCKRVGKVKVLTACDYCQEYIKKEVNIRKIKGNVGERCFLCSEFVEGRRFQLKTKDIVELYPETECGRCVNCTAEESGYTTVQLNDIPINGHPTEIEIFRPQFKSHYNKTECRVMALPGIQNRSISRMTCRLIKICSAAALRGHSFDELSEWCGISKQYLYKMKYEQAKKVAEAHTKNRKRLTPEDKVCYCQESACGKQYYISYCVPSSKPTEEAELIGIYSEEEREYLTKLMNNQTEGNRPSISNSVVQSMAFDMAASNGARKSAYVFALAIAIVDAIMLVQNSNISFDYWQQSRPILDIAINGGSVSDILALARELISISVEVKEDDDPLLKRMRELIEFLEIECAEVDVIEGVGNNCVETGDSEKPQIIYTVRNMLTMDAEMGRSVDEIRDSYLFFNQIAVPYREVEGRLDPVFCEDGSIDNSSIKSVGVKIKCLACNMSEWRGEGSLFCKEALHKRELAGVESNICAGDCQEPIEWMHQRRRTP